MGLFKKGPVECVLCGGNAEYSRTNTKIGPICRDCLSKLVATGEINAFNIHKQDINYLKVLCGGKNAIDKLTDEANLSPVEQLNLLVVNDPCINLKEDETCFYQERASAHHTKNVVVGTKKEGAGISYRLSRDFTIHTGGGGSRTIRDDISELFEGVLCITNQRIVLVSPKYGFDLKFDKITSLAVLGNGLRVFTGSKCYEVYTLDVNQIDYVLELIEKIPKEEKKSSTGKNSKSISSAASEIREYKSLLDDGIITQEEFDRKKAELLGL